MCKFCSDKRTISMKDSEELYKLILEDDRAYIMNNFDDQNDYVSYFEFKYCPQCGRKLLDEE